MSSKRTDQFMRRTAMAVVLLFALAYLAMGATGRAVTQNCSSSADCLNTQWCQGSGGANSCVSKTANGLPVPGGACTLPLGMERCLSGACSTGDNLCGAPNGDHCSSDAQCRGGACDVFDSLCGKQNGESCAAAASSSGECRSGVCDSNNKCGLIGGSACTSASQCQTLLCGSDGLCGTPESASRIPLRSDVVRTVAAGCNVDADCSGGNWCNETTHVCTSKLANGISVPNDPAHTSPALNGVCSAAAGALVCTAGVCDTADSKCGYANGDGPCNASNATVVCRSGACSANGLCEPAGGCNVDADCSGSSWCNESTHACIPRLSNGSSIPNDPAHTNPALNGACTTIAGALVCVAGVCDTADSKCGYANGDGPCNASNATVVCRSGACSANGLCEPAGGCNLDADCSGGNWCNETTHTCNPRLANGSLIPTDPAHTTPALSGVCSAAAGALVCSAGVCDTADNKCGYANGDGPCTAGNAAVCRSGACSANGRCEPAGGCNVDADCSGSNWCNETTHACTPKLASGVPIPSDAAHTSPAISGVCTVAVGAVVCATGVCDTASNKCSYAASDVYVSDSSDPNLYQAAPAGTAASFATLPTDAANPDPDRHFTPRPYGLAFDAAANLYAADFSNDQVFKIGGGPASVFALLPAGVSPTGLAFDISGNLYVASVNVSLANAALGVNTRAIYKISADGSSVTSFAILPGTAQVYGLAFDGSGNLYGADFIRDQIVKISPDGAGGTTVSAFATLESGARPYDLAFDVDGNLYVAESGSSAHKIVKISPDGSSAATFVDLGAGTAPGGLAFDALGELFVVEQGSNQIVKISPDGQTVTPAATGFTLPQFIATPGRLPVTPAPLIAVSVQAGALVDGAGGVNLGSVNVGSSGAALTFTITNPGTAGLASLAVTKDGTNAVDFTVSPLSGTGISVGATTATFTVTFTPGALGPETAAIHLASNVLGTRNPFDITLKGTGIDTELPTVAAHGNVAVEATSAAGAVVTYAPGSATDNVTGTPVISYSQNSGTTFPIGVTTVTIFARDAANNTGTGTFTVTVTAATTVLPVGFGDDVPGQGVAGSGVPAGAKWRMFGIPGIDDGASDGSAGVPVFLGTFSSPTANPTMPLIATGIFGLGGSRALLAKTADSAPETDLGTFASFSEPVGHDGTAFIASVLDKHGKLVKARAGGIWSNAFPDTDGSLHAVARVGSPAAASGANYTAIDALALNDGQNLFWTATLTGPPTKNRALFLQSTRAAGAHVVLQTGDSLTGIAGVTVKSFIALHEGGNGGLTGVAAGFGTGRPNGGATTPVLVTLSDHSTAIFKAGLNTLDLIARTNTATPDIANGNWKTLGLPAAAGSTVAFRAILAPKAGTKDVTKNNAAAIYAASANHALAAIARQGDKIGDAQHQFLAFSDPAVNANGDVQFFAQIAGPKTKVTALCLARNNAGTYTIRVLQQLGGDAPELPGVLFSKFLRAALPQNFAPAVAQYPVFTAVLKSGTTKVKATENSALFAYDGAGTAYLLARTGSPLNGKTLKTIGAFSPVLGSPGQSRAAASGSKVIYRATYTDKTQAIVEVPMP